MKNLTVSVVFDNSYPLSWNFNFCHNLTDVEIQLFQRLMFSLSSMHLSSSVANLKTWSMSSSGLFTVKSFFFWSCLISQISSYSFWPSF